VIEQHKRLKKDDELELLEDLHQHINLQKV
jgi:hypothetical protein